MKKLLVILSCFSSLSAFSQFGKKILEHTKKETEYRINKKVEEKIDKTVETGVNKADTLLTGKKRKKPIPETSNKPVQPGKTGTENLGNPETGNNELPLSTKNEYAKQVNTEWITEIIFTNINCEKGSKAVQKKLTGTAGVKKVSINLSTGEVSIFYSPAETTYQQLTAIINSLHFTADGKVSQSGKNGCN